MGFTKRSGQSLSLECIEPNAAGIDVGATEIYVAVPVDRDAQPVRCFQTFTEDLQAMAVWLKQCGIVTVAMESTGVYWIPVYEVLEAGRTGSVSGERAACEACSWSQVRRAGLSVGAVSAYGGIAACFVSPGERDLCPACVKPPSRQPGGSRLDACPAHAKSTDADEFADSSRTERHYGKSGLAILDAILDGNREPEHLASLADVRVHADQKTVSKALVGNYRSEHLFTLRQSLQAYRQYQQMLAECDREIEQHMQQLPDRVDGEEPPQAGTPAGRRKRRKNQFHFDMGKELYRILGTDLTLVPGLNASTVHTLVSEIGTDLARFPTVADFTSWLALCPANKKSGGKVLSSKTRKSKSRASNALRLAAQALLKSRSYLGDYVRRMRARLGPPQAITAAAHKLARIIYHLITTRSRYDESVFIQEQQKQDSRNANRLRKQALALGYQLVPLEVQTSVH